MRVQEFVRAVVAQGSVPGSGHVVAGRDRLEAGMEAELADHLERLTADLVRSGYAPAEAARRARIALGPALCTRKECAPRWDCDGGMSSRADLALRDADSSQEPGVYGDRGDVTCAGHRREHDDFFCRQEPAVRPAHVFRMRMICACWAGLANSIMPCTACGATSIPRPDGKMLATIFSYPVYQQLRAHNHVLRGSCLPTRKTA